MEDHIHKPIASVQLSGNDEEYQFPCTVYCLERNINVPDEASGDRFYPRDPQYHLKDH